MTDMKSCKLKIKEAVIVEGRDDTAAVKRGVDTPLKLMGSEYQSPHLKLSKKHITP